MKKTIRIVDTTPQQIYLRRAAHSAATYLGYQCHIAFAQEAEAPELLCEGDLPHDAARHPYLRTVFTLPAVMVGNIRALYPDTTIEWHGATPTILDGAGSSLATYVEGLATEILARAEAQGVSS